MHSIVFKGPVGELRWSYHKAADLASWEITGSSLTATVLSHDAFRVSQQPLTFVVPRTTGSWTWSVQSLQIAGTSLTATISQE